MKVKRFIIVFLRELFWFGFLTLIGVALGAVAIYNYGTPSLDKLQGHPWNETTYIYDRTGNTVLYKIHGEENRTVVSRDEIPDTLRAATVAAEDSNFYSHPGIDAVAIVRAIKVNLSSGERSQGASTITQQLARSLFLTRKKTLDRKVREAFLAIKLERHLDKATILDMYLNGIPYGSNAYGCEAASQTFFGKHCAELTLDESALLAILPNAPSLLSPYTGDKDEIRRRQSNLLTRMAEHQVISADAYAEAANIDTLAKVKPLVRPIVAPHFVFYVIEKLKDLYGRETLETQGLRIYTTIDIDLQKKAEEIVKKGVQDNLKRGGSNGSMVALDTRTGEILAMVGSRDYFDTTIDGKVNVSIELRQPGSTFKPFAYAEAFVKGLEPETKVYDVPMNFGPDGSGKDYKPSNYDGKFHGVKTLRESLSQSLNIPAVQALYLAGVRDTIALATRMGISTLDHPERFGLALVLGGAEVRLVDLTSAFGVFGQEGLRAPAEPVLKIIDRDGDEYSRIGDISKTQPVVDPEVTRKINSILSDNKARTAVFGPRSPIAYPAGGVAAKTGTTQNFRDAWTIGYTTKVAVGVWTGNNDGSYMRAGSDGIYMAAPMWRAMMDEMIKKFPVDGPFTNYTPIAPGRPRPVIVGKSGIGSRTIYIYKPTGEIISAEKAAKKKSSKIEVRQSTEFNPDDPGAADFIPKNASDLNILNLQENDPNNPNPTPAP